MLKLAMFFMLFALQSSLVYAEGEDEIVVEQANSAEPSGDAQDDDEFNAADLEITEED